MDSPLILTHDHDPGVVFKSLFPSMDSLPDPDSSMSYDALLSSYQRLSHCYTDLFSRNRELSEANRALREECNTFRDNYWSLRYKHQEVADDAINARIESWRHVVRLEELNKELRLLKQADSQPISGSFKRKFTDVECDDQDGGCSDWSASSSTHSRSFSNDAFNTPASASSKPASAPIINDASDDDNTSCRLAEYSNEIQTPKRRRRTRSTIDGDQHGALPSINWNSEEGHKVTLPDPATKRPPTRLQKMPQTRTKKPSKRRRLPVEDQNATAAAVAAALSGAAASNSPHSSSPPPDRSS